MICLHAPLRSVDQCYYLSFVCVVNEPISLFHSIRFDRGWISVALLLQNMYDLSILSNFIMSNILPLVQYKEI
jgi:hypothetical protein